MSSTDPTTTPPQEPKAYAPPSGVTKEMRWRAPDGAEVRYLVTADWLVLKKRQDPAAEIFHTYYRLADAGRIRRPVTFVCNGGPGASSAYLHMGGLGPKRVAFGAHGTAPAPPANVVDNAESWLAFTDLVFIDPVGTGLSRGVPMPAPKRDSAEPKEKKEAPRTPEEEEEFYRVNRDLDAFGEFAQRFLSRHRLWDVPVVLAGESYGGFRTAKLARRLQEKFGVGLSAAVAISPALEWNLLNQTDYDVLHYVDVFCSMALAAAFHGRSRVFPRETAIEVMRPEIEAFAAGRLSPALVFRQGQDPKDSDAVFARAADLLGLDRGLLAKAHGRIGSTRFARELLRDEQRIVGLYDATITAVDPFPDREKHDGPDPTLSGVSRLFAGAINHWLRGEVGLESDRIYELLSFDVNEAWRRDDQKHVFDLTVGATDDLRFAMSMNPHMNVLITHGYYDLVTPYFASERLATEMRLLPEQKRCLHVRHFAGGHMFYSWESSRRDFRDWVRAVAFAQRP
jgi:carboxypeptidase C (cathepsin A)